MTVRNDDDEYEGGAVSYKLPNKRKRKVAKHDLIDKIANNNKI